MAGADKGAKEKIVKAYREGQAKRVKDLDKTFGAGYVKKTYLR